jgi:hypothetical protein
VGFLGRSLCRCSYFERSQALEKQQKSNATEVTKTQVGLPSSGRIHFRAVDSASKVAHSPVMSSLKQLMEKSAAQQRQVILELHTLVADIERCQKTILDLKSELELVNAKHKDRQTTREDIDYLTDLLKCANKKLTWEKHMASLQKRTPVLLEKMSQLINDPKVPPSDETRAQMLQALQGVQNAMEQLQQVKVN